jgi:hypothetical protein
VKKESVRKPLIHYTKARVFKNNSVPTHFKAVLTNFKRQRLHTWLFVIGRKQYVKTTKLHML